MTGISQIREENEIIARDQYQSYEKKRHFKQGVGIAKQSLISADQMRYITNLAFADCNENPRLQIHNERKALHDQSQERIKKWGNTVFGSFKRRLAAADVKKKLAEEERVKQDKEWAAVIAAEREVTIKRARQLQKFDEPRYRTLHSHLLLSNVLEERDEQIKYNIKQKLNNKIHDKEELLRLRLEHLKNLENDRKLKELKQEKRKIFQEGLAVLVQNHTKAKKMSHGEEAAKGELRKIQEEMKSEAELKLQKKNQLAEEFKIQLASQIKEKEESRQRLERIAQTLDEQNTRFNDMKAMFADQRKAFTNSTIQARIKRTEHISSWNEKANAEKESLLSEYLSKIAKKEFRTVNPIKSVKANEQYAKELAEFKEERERVKNAEMETTLNTQQKERLKHLEDALKWKREEEEISEKRRKRMLELKDFNLLIAKTENNPSDSSLEDIIIQRKKADEEFYEYAESMKNEWKAAKKSTATAAIERFLANESNGNSKRSQAHKDTDHFSRLGFTARDIPVEPKLPPINDF